MWSAATVVVVDACVVVEVTGLDELGSAEIEPENVATIERVPIVRNVVVAQLATPETTGALWHPTTGAPSAVKATVPEALLGATVAPRVTDCDAAALDGDTDAVVVVVVVAVRGVMVTVPLPLRPAPRNEPERFVGE